MSSAPNAVESDSVVILWSSAMAVSGKELGNETRDALRNTHITYMVATKGLLWMGTNVGCILTLPLPRLEGVPQIKGRPTISYHAHTGAIRFLVAVQCGIAQLSPEVAITSDSPLVHSSQDAANTDDVVFIDGVTSSESEDTRGFSRSDEVMTARRASLSGSMKWVSSPDLREAVSWEDDVRYLYGNLLQGMDEELDIECVGTAKQHKRKFIPGLTAVTSNAQIIQTKISQTVAKLSSTPTTPKLKYATLPIVMEDCPVYENVTISDHGAADLGAQDAHQDVSPWVETSQESAGGVAQSEVVTSSEHSTVPARSACGQAMMVISGGEGHVNFSDPHYFNTHHDDVCLLLWQCPMT